ncbi:hypothetical protein BES34_000195 [Leptospira inadai serovar Lyme]|uniref:Lipoprotein n=1 Tax=Leptospira inadai serovar Lyme TaxID=293084 RepID=A0ABX4YN83_9LEPT|nr:hypothetical protein BES34_000195 [Leptospira inadai serovar Lyme]
MLNFSQITCFAPRIYVDFRNILPNKKTSPIPNFFHTNWHQSCFPISRNLFLSKKTFIECSHF